MRPALFLVINLLILIMVRNLENNYFSVRTKFGHLRYYNLKYFTFHRERKLYLQRKIVITIPSKQMLELDSETLPHLSSQEKAIYNEKAKAMVPNDILCSLSK